MTTILAAAASGLWFHQQALDIAANNIANASADGYKRVRALAEGVPNAAATEDDLRQGVGRATLDVVFARGNAEPTGDPLSFAIQDDTFLAVREGGEVLYTRYGALSVDGNGSIVSLAGRQLEPPIVLPEGAAQPAVDATGNVIVINAAGEPEIVGTLSFIRFDNPGGLEQRGSGLFAATPLAGASSQATPKLLAGAIERSNVDLTEEMANVILAQRAYQASLRAFSIGDEMLAIATDLTQ
jgi:flagellar basal body rod protein FlgG